MLPESTMRVPMHTADKVNAQIRQKTLDNLSCFLTAAPEAIARRLAELDEEWDIERALQAVPASMILIGLGLGAFVSRKWLILSAAVSAFLLQHALQGWCPPMPVLRRLGFRTPHEIEQERTALKIIRGDFDGVSGDVDQIVQSVEL